LVFQYPTNPLLDVSTNLPDLRQKKLVMQMNFAQDIAKTAAGGPSAGNIHVKSSTVFGV
jgi:hypothetical protein